jgi:hypothetical protein
MKERKVVRNSGNYIGNGWQQNRYRRSALEKFAEEQGIYCIYIYEVLYMVKESANHHLA